MNFDDLRKKKRTHYFITEKNQQNNEQIVKYEILISLNLKNEFFFLNSGKMPIFVY